MGQGGAQFPAIMHRFRRTGTNGNAQISIHGLALRITRANNLISLLYRARDRVTGVHVENMYTYKPMLCLSDANCTPVILYKGNVITCVVFATWTFVKITRISRVHEWKRKSEWVNSGCLSQPFISPSTVYSIHPLLGQTTRIDRSLNSA